MPDYSPQPPILPARSPKFTAASIRLLVERFYGRVQHDPELGPIFNRVVEAGEGWPAHLDRLTRFWSAVLLHIPGYKGNPRAKHQAVGGITPAHFERWLAIFREEVRAVFEEEPAEDLIEKAERMAVHLQRPGLF